MIPKFDYVRSPALLKACREIPCQNCGRTDGTVVAAHSNQAEHGKGRGIKASDVYVAALCTWCHTDLDQGSRMNRAERVSMWTTAHVRTVAELQRLNLWPARIPAPQQETPVCSVFQMGDRARAADFDMRSRALGRAK